jgi:hypothetical protein
MNNKPKEDINLSTTVETVEKTVKKIEAESEKVIKPIQRTLFKRFPITAVLLVAFGVSATSTAGQLLFMKVGYFVEKPIVLLVIGLGTLILLGKLHQKLG